MKNNYYMNEMAISYVIGIILMVASTIVIAGTIIVMLGGFVPPDIPPNAIISVSDAEGGTTPVTFRNNSIRILHRGGDRLCINETMIVMQGYGQARPVNITGIVGWWGTNIKYHILVAYEHIHSRGKVTPYRTRNLNLLADGHWSAGEILNLNGHDSEDVTFPTSITVIRMDMSNHDTMIIGDSKQIQK